MYIDKRLYNAKADPRCAAAAAASSLGAPARAHSTLSVQQGKMTEREVMEQFLSTFDVGERDGVVTKEEFERCSHACAPCAQVAAP